MEKLPVINPGDECTSIVGAIVAGQMQKGLKAGRARRPAQDVEVSGWKVGQCPNDGNIQVSRSKFQFHCQRCGRTTEWRKEGRWNIKVVLCKDEREAVLKCQMWKKQEG
jgi:hypothetical protein